MQVRCIFLTLSGAFSKDLNFRFAVKMCVSWGVCGGGGGGHW